MNVMSNTGEPSSPFRTSTFSFSNGACVDVASQEEARVRASRKEARTRAAAVFIRDTVQAKMNERVVLRVPATAWQQLVDRIKAAE